MIIIFIIGVIFGSIVTSMIWMLTSKGTLKIDATESMSNPYIFLELLKHPNDIYNKKFVVFTVETRENNKSFYG